MVIEKVVITAMTIMKTKTMIMTTTYGDNDAFDDNEDNYDDDEGKYFLYSLMSLYEIKSFVRS